MKYSLLFIMSFISHAVFSIETSLNIPNDLMPPDKIPMMFEITNAKGEREFVKNPKYDWARRERKVNSGEWDFSKTKPSGSEALEQMYGADIYLKIAKSLGGKDSTLWSNVHWELVRIYSEMDVWEEESVAKWKGVVDYVLANGKNLGKDIIKDSPTNIFRAAPTAEPKVAAAPVTSPTTITGSTASSLSHSGAIDATGDHKTYYKDMIGSLKNVKANLTEKKNYYRRANKNLMDYKGKTVDCSQLKTINTVADAKIKNNCSEIKKLEVEEEKVQANIDKTIKVQDSLPSASIAGVAEAHSSFIPKKASGNNCFLKVNDYSAWGFSRIVMVGSGGSSFDNPKEREIPNGQTAIIESDSMTFQNPCMNGSPWTDWASNSKIHSFYQKAKGKRVLSLVCRDGKMVTGSIRNRPEGTSVDSILFGCNGACEEEMVKCPDVQKTCLLDSIGNKNYLDGEEIAADFWSMNSYSAYNLPYKLESYGSPNNLDIVRKYSEIGTCKNGTEGYSLTKMGKFTCDAERHQWKYIGDANPKSERLTTREETGGFMGLPQSMIGQLPDCSSKGVTMGDTKTLTGIIAGTFTNPTIPVTRFLIVENPWSSTLSFDANGFQSMKGILKTVSKQVFKGTANHVPTGCNTNIPFDLTLTFTSLDEAKYESVILEEGCGMTKGQVFTGIFTKVK